MTNILEIPRDYQSLAKGKIEEQLKAFSGGQKEKAVSEFVASTLTHFCEENADFAEVVYKTKRSLSDCCAEIMKGCGTYISDIDVYRGAVKFYFPNAEVHMNMTIEIGGEAPDDAYLNKEAEKPKPKPAAKKAAAPKPAAKAKEAPAPKPKEKPKPEVIQLSLF